MEYSIKINELMNNELRRPSFYCDVVVMSSKVLKDVY